MEKTKQKWDSDVRDTNRTLVRGISPSAKISFSLQEYKEVNLIYTTSFFPLNCLKSPVCNAVWLYSNF